MDEKRKSKARLIEELAEARERIARLEAQQAGAAEVFARAPVAIALLDAAGRVADVNAAFQSLLGYPCAEILGWELGLLAAPEHVAQADALLKSVQAHGAADAEIVLLTAQDEAVTVWVRAAARPGGGAQLHLRDVTRRAAAQAAAAGPGHAFFADAAMENVFAIARDGRVLWLCDHALVAPDADGKGAVVLGLMTDITERKRAEEELRRANEARAESEARLREMAENIQEAFWVSDPNSARILYVSPAYEQIFGRSCASVRENPAEWLEAIHPDDRPAARESLTRQARGEPTAVESRIVRPDGSIRWILNRAFPVRNEAGEVCRVVGVAGDITERKEAELSLCRSELLHRTTIDAMDSVVQVVDADLRLTLLNAAAAVWCERLGVPPVAMGRPLREALPFLGPEVIEHYRQVFATGQPLVTEESFVFGGRELVNEVRKIPVIEGGKVARVLTLVRDITERVARERALRDALSRLRELESIVNRSPAVAFRWRTADGGSIEFISDNVSQWGYAPDDFTSGRVPWKAVLHPADAERAEKEMADHLRPGVDEFTQEYRLLTGAGEVRWVDVRNRVLRDGSGALTHIEGIVLDVTERKQAEEEFRALDERYRTLTENLPVGIFRGTIGADDCLLMGNPAGARMFGYDSVDDLLGVAVDDLFWDAEGRQAARDMLVGSGRIVGEQFRMKRRDGTPMWVSLTARVVCDGAGRPALGDGIMEDVTESRLAEEALRRSEEQYRLLVETMNEGLVVQSEQGVLTYVNEPLCRMLGYGRDEVVGQPGRRFVAEESMALFESNLQKRRQGSREPCEIELKHKDGRTIPVLLSPQPLYDSEGRFTGSFGVLMDITARKLAEQRQAAFTQGLRTVVEMADELIACTDVDSVCRTAVELCRRRLGLVRCGIFLREGKRLRGTYGTDSQGRTSDEHDWYCRVDEEQWAAEFDRPHKAGVRWRVRENELVELAGQQRRTFGRGWIVTTLLQAQLTGDWIGVMFNDAGLTGAPLDKDRQEVVAVFCSVLGNIINRRRAEQTLRAAVLKSPIPTVVAASDGSLVYYNDAAVELTGYGLQELRGILDWMGRLLPDQQESQAAIEDVRGALAGRPLRRIEYAITRKDGGRRTVELHVAPFPEGVVAEMIDVTGRRRLERELMDVGADLQRRIGQDLHDGLGQMLTGVAFQARALEKRLARLCPQETPKAAAILSLVNDAISQTRALARGLSPVDVAEEGLMGALETCAANVQALTGIRCTFECPEPVPVADNDVATHLYHIAQEAATNAARHAHAANIVIGLSQRDGSMHLTVRDDGVGPPQNLGETPGLGLKIMGYRARMIGAGFEVTRNEGGGTTVLCVLDRPIRQNGKGRKQ